MKTKSLLWTLLYLLIFTIAYYIGYHTGSKDCLDRLEGYKECLDEVIKLRKSEMHVR
ncbi:hypothetical protein GCM10023091_28050 [Ravibacter arvi]|uniref:Uncharacterized protein n=1 Tax=Ravibacter arvi TaxID=2051041 RepID=A0ABP8M3U1_9BACT